MATREKIIVIVAIIAVLIYTINYFPGFSRTKTIFIENNSDDIDIFINGKKKELSGFEISTAELFIINQSDSNWKDNFGIIKKKSDSIISKPKYSGYLSIGNKKFAILDGNEYQIGDQIKSSSYIVKKISPDNVVIQKDNENEVIVPVEKFEFDSSSYIVEEVSPNNAVVRKKNKNEVIVP